MEANLWLGSLSPYKMQVTYFCSAILQTLFHLTQLTFNKFLKNTMGRLKKMDFDWTLQNHILHWKRSEMMLLLTKESRSRSFLWFSFIVKTQRNSTQLNLTQLKSNFVGLDIVLTWNPPTTHHHPQTFQALLD